MGDAAARVGRTAAADAALARFFDAFYRQRPVTATFTGIHAHDHRLPDWSIEGLHAQAEEMRALRLDLDAAGRVPDDAVRAFPQDVDLALADAALEIALAEHDSGRFVHRNPTLWTGEAIFGVLSLVTRDFAPLGDRLRAAHARLEATPAFLGQAGRTLTASPPDWTARAAQECRAAVTLFGETLPAWVRARVTDGTAQGVDVEAWASASTRAAAAFQDFAAAVSRLDASTDEAAGADLLGLLLRRGHAVTAPIPDLLGEATGALGEARARLDAMCAPYGGWAGAQERLADDHPTAEGYLARFHERWLACWQAAHDHNLVTWPIAPLRYVPFPEHTREAAPSLYYLHYRSPAPFDPFGTFDYVVAPIDGLAPDQAEARLRQWNHSVITLNHVVHHGAIGHHVQNHHAYRGASRIGRVAAVDAACRLAMFTGGSLAEGWACYVCDLMEEVGFLTPLERVAQQHTRLRIAARAVADLTLHTGQSSVAAVARHYEAHALMSPAAAKGEAVRNSMYPGAAVMYWLGTQGIHRLRREVWAREDAAFSMRHFHDRLLAYGAIPVALIARLMLAEDAR